MKKSRFTEARIRGVLRQAEDGLGEGRTDLQATRWITLLPGMAILLTVLAPNLMGDRLCGLLDPTGGTKR